MSANKIAETSTSTGTGNFTLAGAWSVPSSFATGNKTFNSFYGLNHRFPYMIQDMNGNWEKGVGYLSAETTLVRETVLDNSLSTTALIDFAAGDKLVMVPTDAGMLGCPILRSNALVTSVHATVSLAATSALTANSLILTPFVLDRPMYVSDLAAEVTTAVAASSVRLGIYQIVGNVAGGSGYNVSLLIDAGTIDSSTTGNTKTAPVGMNLGQGFYLIATVSNSNPTLRAYSQNVIDYGATQAGTSGQTPSAGLSKTDATAHDALPSTIDGGTLLARQNATAPRIALLGRFL